MAALMDLSQLSPPPERVLIEASGVAMPGAIAASVDLLTAYAVDGVLVLADSKPCARAPTTRSWATPFASNWARPI